MSEVTTSKPVDLGQLSAETGAELSATAANGTTTITAAIAQATLDTAVTAHVAPDLVARAANETSVRDKAAQALAANTTDIGTNDGFLAITSPTNAQVAAQVKELTRQSTRQARELNALIRLVLRRFESAD